MSPNDEPPPNASWWKKLLRYAAYALVVVVLGTAAWGLLWYWPRQAGEDLPLLEDPNEELTLEDKLRRQVEVRQLEKDRVATGAQVFLGLGILVGIYLTWRRIRATERQAQTAQDQMELARRQQTAERFTKAVEQLASSEMSIRLGGIYALEKIARDEPVAYFSLFREILCAFVRETARTPHADVSIFEVPLVDEDEEEKLPPLPTDLQAALTVLGRFPPPDAVDNPAHIDWSGTYLMGADLSGAHLEHGVFVAAHLEKAKLFNAHLKDADFHSAHLYGTYLGGAHLESADFGDAWLERASLRGAHLKNASISYAYLPYADLSDAHVERGFFLEAHLNHANLANAHLEGTSLNAANLIGANLSGAHLQGADLAFAFYDRSTRFPEGFELPETMRCSEDDDIPPDVPD